jgi:hypothetical protein
MRFSRCLCLRALAAAVLLTGFGCGSSGPRMYKISGKVTLNNQPVANASIHFEPEGEGDNRGLPADGQTGSDGTYAYVSTKTTGDGIAAGKYKVTISKVSSGGSEAVVQQAPDMKDPQALTKLMQGQFQKQGKQPKAAPKITNELPPDYGNVEKTPLKAEIPSSSNTIDFPLQK